MSSETLAVAWGESLRAARKAYKTPDGFELRQVDLAEMAGCVQATISRIEAGVHKPNDDLRIALARALKTNVEDLFPYKPYAGASA